MYVIGCCTLSKCQLLSAPAQWALALHHLESLMELIFLIFSPYEFVLCMILQDYGYTWATGESFKKKNQSFKK